MKRAYFLATIASLVALASDVAVQAGPVTVVSNTTDWRESTFSTVDNSIPWGGVSANNLPSINSYSIIPSLLPASRPVDPVPGATSLLAPGSISYFRSTFTVAAFSTLSADIRASFDNDINIFINGHPLALTGSLSGDNFSTISRLFVDSNGTVSNGYLGGQPFDSVAATFPTSDWLQGTNEIVLAIRNLGPPVQTGDLGAISFRMDVDTTATPEPASLTLFGIGMAGVAGYVWRKRKQQRIA